MDIHRPEKNSPIGASEGRGIDRTWTPDNLLVPLSFVDVSLGLLTIFPRLFL